MKHIYDIAGLREPKQRALISCQIESGFDGTWVNRTYEVVRAENGQWLVDHGGGAPFDRRPDWAAVLRWLWYLSPRDIEILEE